jgi:hypothetical protein
MLEHIPGLPDLILFWMNDVSVIRVSRCGITRDTLSGKHVLTPIWMIMTGGSFKIVSNWTVLTSFLDAVASAVARSTSSVSNASGCPTSLVARSPPLGASAAGAPPAPPASQSMARSSSSAVLALSPRPPLRCREPRLRAGRTRGARRPERRGGGARRRVGSGGPPRPSSSSPTAPPLLRAELGRGSLVGAAGDGSFPCSFATQPAPTAPHAAAWRRPLHGCSEEARALAARWRRHGGGGQCAGGAGGGSELTWWGTGHGGGGFGLFEKEHHRWFACTPPRTTPATWSMPRRPRLALPGAAPRAEPP